MRYIFILAALIFCLEGCATTGSSSIIDDSRISQIQKGVSTKEDVRSLFGSPTKVDFTDAGYEVWEYVYSRSQTRASSFLPYLGAVAGGSDSVTHTLTIQFTEEGVVRNIGRGQIAGKGGSVFD
ncbi:MAG: outer membrane protein assembly factor BamE [Candidatus Omnitrophota bacterium]